MSDLESIKVRGDVNLKVSGIYVIRSVILNDVYIGASVNIGNRYRDHCSSLYKNNHPNSSLQTAYNNNPSSFYFEILEECCVDRMRDRENHWISEYNSIEEGFNAMTSSYSSSKEAKRKALKRLKRDKLYDEFYDNMRKLSYFKDVPAPDGVLLAVNNLRLNDNNGKLKELRLFKFGRMMPKIMDEIYSLESGGYKLTHINYLKQEADYSLYPFQIANEKYKNFGKIKTNEIYERISELVIEDLNSTPLGRRVLKGMEQRGIELRTYTNQLNENCTT